MELSKIETALDNGQLWTATTKGKWYRCRRNGATKLWKTRPGHFKIGLKWGFKSHTSVEHTDRVAMAREISDHGQDYAFVISRNDPNSYAKRSAFEIEMLESHERRHELMVSRKWNQAVDEAIK